METREDIYARMLRDVARAWGYQDSEVDVQAFDPVVGQLLSACAAEFDKLRQETNASRQRILDRLIATLTPDTLTAVTPAHTIVHACSIEPESVAQPSHQFFFKKTVDKTQQDIYFSPAAPYRIVNASVRYLAVPGKLIQVDELPKRTVVAQSDRYQKGAVAPTLWIGIRLHPKLRSLNQLAFFFNWRNDPNASSYLRQMPFCRWYAGSTELKAVKGLREQVAPQKQGFEHEFSPAERIKHRTQAYYDDHFVTLTGSKNGAEIPIESLLQAYPNEFEALFPLEDLMECTDKLLWLRVEFPEYFRLEALAATECLLNCIPAINRQLHKETYRMPEQINILPLPSDGFFFDIMRVYNEQEKELTANPLANLRDLEAGTYTFRNQGVGKLDDRAASRHLHNLLDLLRDESAAFSAYNFNYLDEQIRKLNQNISELEEKVKDSKREDLPFLVVKPAKNERNRQVTVEYWSTNGDIANAIPAWTSLEMFATRGFDRENLQLVTSSIGGSNGKSPSESFYEFKKALTTRDRIISKEDIKTFCFARLGNRLQDITIQKGFCVSDLPGEGVIRTLDVLLQLAPAQNEHEAAGTANICRELAVELNEKSSGLLPIQVKN